MSACGKTYDTLEQCYADRVNHRAFWYEAISLFNAELARLATAILADLEQAVDNFVAGLSKPTIH